MGRTFLYMTPECLIEFEQASRSSDIWSLVATHLEIFTKSVPWTVKKTKTVVQSNGHKGAATCFTTSE